MWPQTHWWTIERTSLGTLILCLKVLVNFQHASLVESTEKCLFEESFPGFFYDVFAGLLSSAEENSKLSAAIQQLAEVEEKVKKNAVTLE